MGGKGNRDHHRFIPSVSMKNFDPESQGELPCSAPELPLSVMKLTLWAEDLSHITVHQKKIFVFNLCLVGLFVANTPSAQTPVTHQMTAMSISRDPENSSETEEIIKTEEASAASSSSGRWFGLCRSRSDTDLLSRFEQ